MKGGGGGLEEREEEVSTPLPEHLGAAKRQRDGVAVGRAPEREHVATGLSTGCEVLRTDFSSANPWTSSHGKIIEISVKEVSGGPSDITPCAGGVSLKPPKASSPFKSQHAGESGCFQGLAKGFTFIQLNN